MPLFSTGRGNPAALTASNASIWQAILRKFGFGFHKAISMPLQQGYEPVLPEGVELSG
jgi:hypothetical protein